MEGHAARGRNPRRKTAGIKPRRHASIFYGVKLPLNVYFNVHRYEDTCGIEEMAAWLLSLTCIAVEGGKAVECSSAPPFLSSTSAELKTP